MIRIIHGENNVASRKELNDVKEKRKDWEIIQCEGKNLLVNDFIQMTQSASLTGFRRLITIDNLFAKKLNKKSAEFEHFFSLLNQIDENCDVIFWEEKELSKTILSNFPKLTDIALFKPDQSIFVFVESIRPGNYKQMLNNFAISIENDAPEYVFIMLIRQFRLLIMVADLGKNTPELSSWQISKLSQQAGFFGLSGIVAAYRKLFDIDVTIKTGQSPFNLTESIKFFLSGL